MRNPFKRKRTRFPNGIPQVLNPNPGCNTNPRNRCTDNHADPASALDLDDPRHDANVVPDPSDWLDDIDPLAWDEVGKTSYGDPVYVRPLSNGREHG